MPMKASFDQWRRMPPEMRRAEWRMLQAAHRLLDEGDKAMLRVWRDASLSMEEKQRRIRELAGENERRLEELAQSSPGGGVN